MSYNWNYYIEKEEKIYETKSTVTISTDEYRDLIKNCEILKIAGQREHDDWYKAHNEVLDLKKMNESLIKKNNEFIDYLNEKELVQGFKIWKAEKSEGYQE